MSQQPVAIVATSTIVSPYLTAEEAVRYLRMEHLEHPKKQYLRWIREGKIRCGGRPGEPLATKHELDAFVALHGRKTK
jgi:hypothetical protein